METVSSNIIIPQSTGIDKPKKSHELFYFGYVDELGYFRFESAYNPQDLEQGKEFCQLVTPNSFYRKLRSLNTLHTLYALWLDLDGWESPFQLSYSDILARFRELGFTKDPTFIIRTSEGHYHIVILLQPLRAFPEKIDFWKKVAAGLAKCFLDFGCDVGASSNPVGFVRIPGHPNYKYADKPIVEVVYHSDTVLTLSEIHQVLIDNAIIKKPKEKTQNEHKGIKEKIAILEKGVPHGIGNYVCFTLAIYYREQGLTQDEAQKKLLDWNARLEVPDPECKVKSTVRSAYKNGYGLSIKKLNEWVSIASVETQSRTEKMPHKKSKKPRNRIDTYAQKIHALIESQGGSLTISQRSLSRQLQIPFRSFSHALKKIPDLEGISQGKGRAAKTTFNLIQRKNLKLVYSAKNYSEEMTQINDANPVCNTEERGGGVANGRVSSLRSRAEK